jgi:hypothetical protein
MGRYKIECPELLVRFVPSSSDFREYDTLYIGLADHQNDLVEGITITLDVLGNVVAIDKGRHFSNYANVPDHAATCTECELLHGATCHYDGRSMSSDEFIRRLFNRTFETKRVMVPTGSNA